MKNVYINNTKIEEVYKRDQERFKNDIEKSAGSIIEVVNTFEKDFSITVNTETFNYRFTLDLEGSYHLMVAITFEGRETTQKYYLDRLYRSDHSIHTKQSIVKEFTSMIEKNFKINLYEHVTFNFEMVKDNDPFKNIPFYNVKNDRSYLQGELIPLKESIISEDRICISASHTLYANIHLPKEKAGKEDLNILFKQVKKLAKDQKVRLNGQKRINDMLKNEEVFQLAHNEITDIYKQFQNLRRLYTIILERGLHMGTSEDILMEYTTIHKWKFEESTRQAKKFQLVNDTFKKLEEVKQDLLFNYDDDWKLTSIEI
jgi:hypothetical protein